ncbi:MarR family winged helix-turn-helix transcriptional regulator [Pseudacidovorax sp. RU35E]|uniref:MarR family winged helix-turn-helix transcriptional regulator n=1 Tax=Pseudacidovorax sp. RU35E TaxID=1907403 RepID=UPI0009558859|nr:MarR family transcriptional regulator [Pseudacidovorax sp. RU35E]SIQ19817.1 transcriptional regulator, MarR family [Pseudacidovorax sp. RU35E]
MKIDPSKRFSFLVNQVAKLHGAHFDRLARERMGLSLAQCRLLWALAHPEQPEPLSQAALAQRLETSAMAVATLCDRMETGGWIRREPSPHDRRVKLIHATPRALEAMDEALAISDEVLAHGLVTLSADEQAQLLALLAKAREGLLAWQTESTPAALHDGDATRGLEENAP